MYGISRWRSAGPVAQKVLDAARRFATIFAKAPVAAVNEFKLDPKDDQE